MFNFTVITKKTLGKAWPRYNNKLILKIRLKQHMLRVHCAESNQTLYALPSLKKSGVMEGELVLVHSSLIHSGV